VEGACFQNAKQDLKKLWNRKTGETYPIGLWLTSDYPAARLSSKLIQIVAEEKLGYSTILKGAGTLAQDAFYALMGCRSPLDGVNRGCSGDATLVHINVEAWRMGYADEFEKIQAQYPEVAPKLVGSMGYSGFSGWFVTSEVQQKAYEAEGMNLDFFRDYNVTWKSPGRYFSQPGDLNVSDLSPCTETALMTHAVMSQYVHWSGDDAGVVLDASGNMVGKCFDNYFWYSPGCRANPGTCFTWLTAGSWGINEAMLKATVYNMPMAVAVAKTFANWASMPLVHDMVLYWWVPDSTFLRLAPQAITFPANNRDEWRKGNRKTESSGVPIEKLVSHDLFELAPDVEELLRRFEISLETIDAIMLDQLNTDDGDFDVACRWLQANEDKWTTWVPEQGKCFTQFGMYNEQTKAFLATREDVVITCQACPSGTFSDQLTDDQGTTFICKACTPGHFQASGASVSCDPCPAGSFQNETGSIACSRCPLGWHQEAEGSRNCVQCSAGATTQILGSTSGSDCGCEAGSINVAENGEELQCIPCGEGLSCPFSSSLETFKSGQSSQGGVVPTIKEGYFATFEKPLEIMRCRPYAWCPGGTPGTCAGGLLGEPCAVCPDGKTWWGEACEDCQFSILYWLGALLLALLCLPSAYFIANRAVTPQAKPFKAAGMGFGLAVATMQLLALLGLMSAKWPDTIATTSSNLQFVLLDLDALGLSCALGSSSVTRYLMMASAFPAAVLWLVLCHTLTMPSCLRKWALNQWKWAFTLNTVGLGLKLAFGTMAAIAFKPTMCYKHPNGHRSILSYPNTFCGGSDHWIMLCWGGILLFVFVLGFLVLCAHATWNLPRWSTQGQVHKVQSFRFCTSNFRFDAYWFILPQLFRSLGFALSVAVGTNIPPAQTALASIVLIIYATLQAAVRPWKAPAINVADTAVNAGLLLLVSKSIQTDADMEADFAEYFTLAILLWILCCLGVLGLLCILALVLQLAGGDWNRPLNLGQSTNSQPEALSQALKQCTQILLKINAPELTKEMAGMNCYDVKTVINFIALVTEWNQDNDMRRSLIRQPGVTSRVAIAALNKRLTTVLTPAVETPGEEIFCAKDGNEMQSESFSELDSVEKERSLTDSLKSLLEL